VKSPQIEADAFGTPLSHDGSVGNPERYTGKPWDEDFGAYVFPFRNYRPEEGRWMSGDPSGFPDGMNGQAYTGRPLQYIDPLGLKIIVSQDTTGIVQQTLNQIVESGVSSTINELHSSTTNYLLTVDPNRSSGYTTELYI
jgi:RHS repeat-associated protein